MKFIKLTDVRVGGINRGTYPHLINLEHILDVHVSLDDPLSLTFVSRNDKQFHIRFKTEEVLNSALKEIEGQVLS